MIIKEIFYGVKCDRCGTINESGDYTFMADEGSAVDEANENDWFIDDFKHYCPNCFLLNEETDDKTVKPPIPDLVVKIKRFVRSITKIDPDVEEKEGFYTISFNEYQTRKNDHILTDRDVLWICSFENVNLKRINNPKGFNKVVIVVSFL